MARRWGRLELALLGLGVLLLVNLADSTARYLATYYLAEPYPLGGAVRPLVFAGAVLLAGAFGLWARSEASGRVLSPRSLEGVAFLAAATGLLYLDVKVLAALGVPVPYAVADAAWFALYALALVAFPVFLALRLRRPFGWAVAGIFLLLAAGFLAKLLEHLYFWVQNVSPAALPYGLVLVGMFGPGIAVASAGFLALAVTLRRGPIAVPSRAFVGVLAVPLLPLIPATMQALGASLPNLILRGWIFWSLGYVGYGWFTPSLFAAAFAAYLFLLVRHRAKTFPRRLLFLALLVFPLSGVFVLFLDYSSIPGNLLALAAAALALDRLAPRGEAR